MRIFWKNSRHPVRSWKGKWKRKNERRACKIRTRYLQKSNFSPARALDFTPRVRREWKQKYFRLMTHDIVLSMASCDRSGDTGTIHDIIVTVEVLVITVAHVGRTIGPPPLIAWWHLGDTGAMCDIFVTVEVLAIGGTHRHKGSFTIHYPRTFRFMKFSPPHPTVTRMKMSPRKRCQNENVRPFFENLETFPLPSKARSFVKCPAPSWSWTIRQIETQYEDFVAE